ncbi:MAG TPA: hypothetical protein VL595_33585 [Pseudonocardia sp.]|nr:hypothetical protein [Pseudonocardia sp.]
MSRNRWGWVRETEWRRRCDREHRRCDDHRRDRDRDHHCKH